MLVYLGDVSNYICQKYIYIYCNVKGLMVFVVDQHPSGEKNLSLGHSQSFFNIVMFWSNHYSNM